MPKFRAVSVLVVLAAVVPAQEATHVPVEAFRVAGGLEVTLWASSPLLHNPTNIDVDHRGRIWVTEGVNYRAKARRREQGDRVVVLTDRDGDGVADDSKVFVQEPSLLSPLGIAVFDNVVVVSQPPAMIVYTDVDRDLRFDAEVDRREVLLEGFHGRNHDHSLHSVTAGPDGRWYWNSGNCGAVFTDRSNRTFRIASSYMDPDHVAGQRSDDGHVYVGGFTARMEPGGNEVEIIGHNYRNSYEQVVTSFGDVFHSDNDDPPACRVTHVIEYGNAGFASRDGKRSWRADRRRGQSTAVAEWRQEDPGTMPAGDVYGGGSPTGVAFYENGALGEQWRGLLLACEPGRNTIFGYFPKRRGAGFLLERFDFLTTNPRHEFVGSDFTGGRWDGELHTQFRPSDVCVGADGAIYVADWFDGRVGGHQTLDDSLSGAIYRVAPKGFVPKVPKIELGRLDADATPEQFDGARKALFSPAVNVRWLGLQRYREAGTLPPPPPGDDPFLAARWLWLLAHSGDTAAYKLELTARHDADPERRLVAFRALRRARGRILELAADLATDESAFVRAAVATALRDVKPAGSLDALVEIARRFDGQDRSYLDAFGIGCTGKEDLVYERLAAEAGPPTKWSEAMAWIAWRLGAAASVPALRQRCTSGSLPVADRRRALTALAFVRDERAMRAMLDLATDETFALRDEAVYWCVHRMGNEWREFGLAERLQQRGIYDPDAVDITPVEVPPEPAAKLAFGVDDVLSRTGDAQRGAARAAACYTCHVIAGRGVDFGPDLTAFGRTQSRRAITAAILSPSESISHGFEGHRVETDAGAIEGIVLADGDPVIVQSQGGLVQVVPKRRVTNLRRMKRSLMWPAQLFALDAQACADLVAFLRQQ